MNFGALKLLIHQNTSIWVQKYKKLTNIQKPIYEKVVTYMKLNIGTTRTIFKKVIYGKIDFRKIVDVRMEMTLLLVKFLDFLTLLSGLYNKKI